MVNKQEERLDVVFGALADATRRGILARLAEGAATVSELAKPYTISLPAVSKHLKVLENAGLLTRDVEGRVHRCHLEGSAMRDAARWIERYRRFWEDQLDSLEAYFVSSDDEKGAR